MSQVGSLSSFTYAGMAGLSLASCFGIFRLWKHFFCIRSAALRKDADIAGLRHSLSLAQLDAQAERERLTKEFNVARNELGTLLRDLEAVRSHNRTLGEQIKTQDSAFQSLKNESRLAREKHAQTVQLLDARTMELKGAEAFLTKADALSGADVISMLNALNSEIYQTAALVAESFEFEERKTKDDEGKGAERSEEDEEIHISATEIVGTRMADLLRSSAHHEDPTLVQIAFQTGMSAYTNWIVSSWDFVDPDDERLLGDIYKRLRSAEEQAVSGRWRALTRTYVQRTAEHEPDLAMYFIDAFINILLVAGVTHDHTKLHEEIATRFSERVAVIVKGAQMLRKAIGEDVTSCDFEMIFVPHDKPFDPSKMDDTFAGTSERGKDTSELVLCTTELGLVRIVKKPGKIGEWDQAVLLRPKIALLSGINEMLAGEDTA